MNGRLPSRAEMLEEQKETEFDIIVIGGGITGAGVARDASLRGLSVALLEKDDFSSGTSSMSTKLLHGGLRYLKNYEFGLVREAALERKVNLEIAPHLGYIDEFLVPMYRWSDERPFMLRLGLWLYDILAFPKNIGRHRWLSKEKLVEREPLLDNDDLKSGGMYHDVQTHDSRLTLANILSAMENGAAVTNYTMVNTWEHDEDGVVVKATDRETDTSYQVRGKVLINCTGPWTEIVENRVENFRGEAKLRATWGAHLRLKKKSAGYPLLIVNEDGRAVFMIPQEDYDLAGTTDIDYKGDPDKIAPTEYDKKYILTAVNKLFPKAQYAEEDIVAAFSGLRPLVYQSGVEEGKISRNHEIFVSDDGVVTIAGGKLTTYRIMAKEAVEHALKELGLSKRKYKCTTADVPLHGGDVDYEDWDDYFDTTSQQLMDDYDLDEKSARKMVRYYGSEITRFRKILDEHGTTKFKKGRPWLEAQVLYACRHELARNPVDFLRRRTWMMLEEENGTDVLDRVIELMTLELDWNEEMQEEMRASTLEYIDQYIKIQPTEQVLDNQSLQELPEIPK